jgi:hypothetical protein
LSFHSKPLMQHSPGNIFLPCCGGLGDPASPSPMLNNFSRFASKPLPQPSPDNIFLPCCGGLADPASPSPNAQQFLSLRFLNRFPRHSGYPFSSALIQMARRSSRPHPRDAPSFCRFNPLPQLACPTFQP